MGTFHNTLTISVYDKVCSHSHNIPKQLNARKSGSEVRPVDTNLWKRKFGNDQLTNTSLQLRVMMTLFKQLEHLSHNCSHPDRKEKQVVMF